MKSKRVVSAVTAIALSAGIIGGLGMALKGFNSADSTTGITNTDTTSYVSVGEIWDSGNKSFNSDNLDILYKYLTGNASASYDNVASLASNTTTATNIRSKTLSSGSGYSAKSSSQDVIVTLGGLKWEVVYISNNTDGEPTLTLWLSNSTQEAFKSRSKTEGAYYGYYEGGLYSDWSADWDSSRGDAYTVNMYGTSYIRAVTLNNGGQYATSNSVLSGNTTKSTSSVFAPFTVESYGMTEYIVKPTKMSWQRDQSSKNELGKPYTLPNEAISPSTTKWSFVNYLTKFNYTAWEYDNLWLPSLAETGYSDSKLGMWGLSVDQRKNNDGSTQSISLSGAVGSSNTGQNSSIYNYTWLRSGFENNANWVYFLTSSGDNYNDKSVYFSCAVRPALHLNLKSVQASLPDLWEDFSVENYAGGIGTEANPYIIKTAEQLAKLAKDSRTSTLSGMYYKLGGNIDLSEHIWTGIGNREIKFSGNFDGGYYCIENIKTSSEIYKIKGKSLGLFAEIITPAKIKNVIMKGGAIELSPELVTGYNNDSGVIVGKCETECVIENCIVEGVEVKGLSNNSSGGGIAGCFSNGVIRNCIVKGSSINSEGTVGGICGWRGRIEDCSVINSTIYTGWGVENNREISIGWSDNATIISSYSAAVSNGTYKKIMYGDDDAWGNWSFHPSLNDGYPIQKTLFHIGGISGSQNVYNYLTGTLKFSVI